MISMACSAAARSAKRMRRREKPPQRVGRQLAGEVKPIYGLVQRKLGRRTGEDEQHRIGLAPNAAHNGIGVNEVVHSNSGTRQLIDNY
jgi:hypothetical protein